MPKSKVRTRWTIVQHSGAGYADKEEWKQGIEIRQVDTLADQQKVIAAGGKLFDDYSEASEYEYNEAYPADAILLPRAPGTFSDKEIDGLRIYIPR